MNRSILMVLLLVASICTMPLLIDDIDGDDGIRVTDGIGNTITLDQTPEHVIAIGKGVNATLIRLGMADRIVVCDNYSTNADEPELDILDERRSQGMLLADGNIYTSGRSALTANCVASVDMFGFDRDRDLVLITGSEGYVQYILDDLKEYGFENIATWYDITSFGELSEYVETISILMTGDTTEESEQMKTLPGSISDALGTVTPRDAMCITYSAGEFKVNNAGSLAGSMIVAAGGNAFTVDASKPGPTYHSSIPALFADGSHSDAVVFVDHQIMDDGELLSRLMMQLPDSVTIVGLEPLWNNFDIESMDGVQAMAQAMYPSVFGEYTPNNIDDDEEDTLHYAGAMILALILITTGYIAFMRKR